MTRRTCCFPQPEADTLTLILTTNATWTAATSAVFEFFHAHEAVRRLPIGLAGLDDGRDVDGAVDL